jgi:Patatin-like phospholipase
MGIEMTDTQTSTNDNNPARDSHLFGSGPKRMLALDGGGVRGAITVAFLERIEKLLDEEIKKTKAAASIAGPGGAKSRDQESEPEIRLSDWFDLVGGTSTGAIIAGALALGKSTAEIKDFYLRLAPRVFTRPFWRLPGLQAKFDARALREEIDKIVKDRTLDSPDLKTGLCVITKRLDTGSPWILANNPRASYWDSKAGDPEKKATGHWGNRYYRLANLVRASTAAPHFFDPEVVAITEDEREQRLADVNAKLAGYPLLSLLVSKLRVALLATRGDPDAKGRAKSIKYNDKGLQSTHGLFVDGGVTPHNNPSMALLMMSQLKAFGIEWPLGPDKLSIISIGTGTYRTKLSFKQLGWFGPLRVTLTSLLSLMGDTETLALAQMQWLGECPQPWEINSEIGDMAQDIGFGRKWFRFLRYDLRLESAWLKEHLNLDLTEREVERFRRMDDPGIIKCIYGIARIAAEQQVKLEHLLDKPASRATSEVALSA